jgi:hypothetical protein
MLFWYVHPTTIVRIHETASDGKRPDLLDAASNSDRFHCHYLLAFVCFPCFYLLVRSHARSLCTQQQYFYYCCSCYCYYDNRLASWRHKNAQNRLNPR